MRVKDVMNRTVVVTPGTVVVVSYSISIFTISERAGDERKVSAKNMQKSKIKYLNFILTNSNIVNP